MISADPNWRSWRRLFRLRFLPKGRLLLVDWRMNAQRGGPRAGAAPSVMKVEGFVREAAATASVRER